MDKNKGEVGSLLLSHFFQFLHPILELRSCAERFSQARRYLAKISLLHSVAHCPVGVVGQLEVVDRGLEHAHLLAKVASMGPKLIDGRVQDGRWPFR